MTILVGLILLLVFLSLAALLFFERAAALFALPLMGIAFLLIAAGADLLQPATITQPTITESTDAFGRRVVHMQAEPTTTRFELWKQMRAQNAALLHERAVQAVLVVAALQTELAAPDETLAPRLRTALTNQRLMESQTRQQAQAAWNALPDFCAHPPHHAGQRARFFDAYDAIPVTDRVKSVATILEHAAPADARPQIRDLLVEAGAAASREQARHAAPIDPASLRFRTVSALSYVWEYLLLVLHAGSLRLYAAALATLFGGMFALYLKNLYVAQRLVYWTAEFAGQRPFTLALAVFLVTAGLFTSIGGLGTVITLGTIILPSLRAVGLSPVVSAGTFLMAIAMGGTLNPVARRLWLDFFGLAPAELNRILWTVVALYALCALGWIWWGTRRARLCRFDATADETPPAPPPPVPARLMIAPALPITLVYLAGIDEVSAFIVSIAYMFLCVARRPGAGQMLARSLIEGGQTVIPPILLMLGIGILITAVETAPVQGYLRPLLALAVPESRWAYILLFSLAAPLALYRGPLNIWGMGLAVAATLAATSTLSPAAILGALLAAGMLQSVCDPTNTANVWIAGFQGVTVNQILRYTILPVWVTAVAAVVLFGLRLVGQH